MALMSCLLVVSGATLDVDLVLTELSFEPEHLWQRGEPAPAGRVHEDSGFSVLVSPADPGNLDTQVEEALEFLDAYAHELRALIRARGLQDVYLHFGAVAGPDVAVPRAYLPPELTRRAGALGLGLLVSHFPAGIDDGEDALRT